MFSGNGGHAQQLLQVLQIAVSVLGIIGTILGLILTYILKSLRDLRSEIKAEGRRFDDFVRADACRLHREVIEQHMRDYESRVNDALSHCKHRSEK